MSTGKLNDSAATWDRALKIAENPQPAAFEANYGRVVGLNEYNRAKIAHLMGRFQDAIRSAGRSKELLDQLKTVPFKEQQSIDPLLAVMPVNHLAIARRELGQYAEAMTAHDEAVARMKELNGPKANRDILFWVCEVRQERAKTAVAISEQRTAAAADLVEISRIAEKLVDENPHIAHYREKLAAVYLTRGELLALLGQFEPAAAELTKSLAASRELIDRFGSLSASMLVRGQTFLVLGRVRNAVGKKDEAAANWKNASKVFELSIKPDPDNFHLRRGLTEAERAIKPPAK
jgi:tetratricopeptide (TPR) repeat protein